VEVLEMVGASLKEAVGIVFIPQVELQKFEVVLLQALHTALKLF
jgi:hypothetical protein